MSTGKKGRHPEVRIFVSYAHKDPTQHKAAVEAFLKWPNVEVVTKWSDHDIDPGSDPDKAIKAELEQMDIFLPLISPFFAASWYIQNVEVVAARRRCTARTVLIAPVVISHPGANECDWLMGLELLPDKTKTWAQIQRECRVFDGYYDEAIKPIRDGVKKLVDAVLARKKAGKRKF